MMARDDAEHNRGKFVATDSAFLRGFFWRWSSYNNFVLDKATVAACPIQIDYVRLPLGTADEKMPRSERR